MRIFLLPSWCPTVDAPIAGTFFVEQAHGLARARPHWTIAICLFDLARTRIPWRAWQWPRFTLDWANHARTSLCIAASGLHEYRVWAPYAPRFGSQSKWQATADGLAMQARAALASFTASGGKPDLIHALAAYPGGTAAVLLGREFRIPVGITEHLGPFPPPALCNSDGKPLSVVVDAYAGAARHSAVSHALAEQIVALGLASKVVVLPNFLPDDFGAGKVGDGTRSLKFSFLSVGGPSHEKGTDVLLQALAKMAPDVTLRVVGSGPQRSVFQQMAASLGVAERVMWLGSVPRSDMPDVYRNADAFVLPSRTETFGVSLIEALAHGKPLISTRCGGPQDIVNPGNGLLVPVDDVAALARAMELVVRASKAYNADLLRADFLARFSTSAVIGRIEDWYLALKADAASRGAA